MIISGSTAYYRVNFMNLPMLSLVDAVVFSFSTGGRVVLKKRYPEDTQFIDGALMIPLSQKDTSAICGHGFIEAQINYKSGCVDKTAAVRYYVAPSASTELVDGNAPGGDNSLVTIDFELEDPHYIKGEPGISSTHVWNGSVLTITSAAGSSSADLRGPKGDTGARGIAGPAGPKGDDGYTPVRGTDYFTAADQAKLVKDVLKALPTWTGGNY